ncbi:MAG: fibronectin type III domain-containing protein [Armatimonadota bacterium]|nr:fibronectin type III domain-containing protein [Armatimonadota bacterium]
MLLLWTILALGIVGATYAQTGPTVTVKPVESSSPRVLILVDGKPVEIESAHLQRGMHVMVWVRDLEKLGWGTVESPTPDRFVFKGGGVTLSFTKGEGTAMINSLTVQLPINTYVRDGKLMVPLSFVAKALGFNYECIERPVAMITTAPQKTARAALNTLQGVVTYNGKGVGGIVVRAVDPQFRVIKNAVAKTDPNGDYKIEGLPDGVYLAYVYTGDNPGYFNRASSPVEARGGGVFEVPPIRLGKVISPINPKPGTSIRAAQNGHVSFAWTPCEDAARYRVTIRRRGSSTADFQTSTAKPSVEVPVSMLKPGTAYEIQITAENESCEFLGGTAGTGGKPWTFSVTR